MNKYLLFSFFYLGICLKAAAGLLDSCGQFQINGVISKKKSDYILTIFPGQMSSINLIIYQMIDPDLRRLPKNLELFLDVPVVVDGQIKKQIKARAGNFILEDIHFRDFKIVESLSLQDNMKLKKAVACQK